MLNYWNCTVAPFDPKTCRDEEYEWDVPEATIIQDYILRNINNSPDRSVKSWWELLRAQFIVFGYGELDVFWPKYSAHYDYSAYTRKYFFKDDVSKCRSYCWTFSKWLALYKGALPYKETYEKLKFMVMDFQRTPPTKEQRHIYIK